MDFDWLTDWMPDIELPLSYIVLMLAGGLFGLFTASGGFSYMISGQKFNPGVFTKIVSTLGGVVIGYLFAYYGEK